MIDMPEELKKIMSRQAGAEREKRATITKAEGDKLAAENLAAAAAVMGRSPGAMQLRTLQTIDRCRAAMTVLWCRRPACLKMQAGRLHHKKAKSVGRRSLTRELVPPYSI